MLRGDSPGSIPFFRLKTTKLIVNTGGPGAVGASVPAAVVREADSVVGGPPSRSMKIDTAEEGGSTVLRLGGRLDREWAEHLSNTLQDLLRDGARSLVIDLSEVSYVSSAATGVLHAGSRRWPPSGARCG